MQGSTFATSYDGLVVVGVRSRTWEAFPNERGETVPAGAKHYLQVVKRGPLGTVGEVLVDGGTAAEIESLGFGTVVSVTGAPVKEGRSTVIKAEAIEVTETAAA